MTSRCGFLTFVYSQCLVFKEIIEMFDAVIIIALNDNKTACYKIGVDMLAGSGKLIVGRTRISYIDFPI